MMENYTILIRLLLGALFGGLIGLEREASNRPAGFRTHILVCLGSTLMTLISISHLGGTGDPGRIAAAVVSGIGFLGAGTIMKTGNHISGLTTAASLWVCAGIGLAVGSGNYFAAIITLIIVLFSLVIVGFVEKKFFKKKFRIIDVLGQTRPGLIGDIGAIFGRHKIIIKSISMQGEDMESEDDDSLESIEFIIRMPRTIDYDRLFKELYSIRGLLKIKLDGEDINNIKK